MHNLRKSIRRVRPQFWFDVGDLRTLWANLTLKTPN